MQVPNPAAHSVTAFYGVAGYSQMALHTALGLVLLSCGVLASRPERGVTAILAQDNSAGSAARRVLPLLVGALAISAWVLLKGQQARYYGTEVGLALMVAVTVSILAATTLWNAYYQGLGDDERQRVSEQLRLAIEVAPTGMIMIDHRGAIVVANAKIERLFGYDRQELLGRSIETLIPESSRVRHAALRTDFLHAHRGRPLGAGPALFGLPQEIHHRVKNNLQVLDCQRASTSRNRKRSVFSSCSRSSSRSRAGLPLPAAAGLSSLSHSPRRQLDG